MPGQIDVVFRGVKIPRSEFEASNWKELLDQAETKIGPMVEEVRTEKLALQKAQKDEGDSFAMMETLRTVSAYSADLGGLANLKLFKGVIIVVANDRLNEFRNSIPKAIFLAQPLAKEQTLAMVAVEKQEEGKLDKAMKLLELKPLVLPPEFPQNPSEAYKRADLNHLSALEMKKKAEEKLGESRKRLGDSLLALRELTEVARKTLDEARVSGGMKRLAMISGYIPAKVDGRLKHEFGRWIVHTEDVGHEEENVPTLMVNRGGLKIFQPLTKEQGIPGKGEVDPTPLVSFVFPIFFGLMFGDVGHGIILTLFMLLVRQRTTGNPRQWANIFLVAGVSSTIFGVLFGEFFELSFSQFVPIPPLVEIIHRAAGTQDSFNFLPTAFAGVNLIMIASILIGVAHLTTALSLDIYQGFKEHERLELLLEKIPVLTMYLSGFGYGLAFIGAGFKFNVLNSSGLNPLLGIPNNVLGGLSLAILVPSMLILLAGKSVAIAMGKIKEGSALGALSDGGLEVFERISQFLSNTISYVRLAVMLLVHAALLLIINLMQPWSNPVYFAPWVVLNLLILTFEAFIVYVQDLRLHLYEFFTKFYAGKGAPFRKILPDRVRILINWL
jgi:V/A-type H+/Na+-transporting ATPase subunit I